jgi:hypothetical protein
MHAEDKRWDFGQERAILGGIDINHPDALNELIFLIIG